MFSQSFSERHLNLVVRCGDQSHSLLTLQREFERDMQLGFLSHIGVQEEVAVISVIGMPDSQEGPIAHRAFAALGELGLRIISIAQAASEYSVSLIIAENDVARAVPFIHRKLGL